MFLLALSCLVLSQVWAEEFILHGRVRLPYEPPRNYSMMPEESCLYILVQENIACDECEIPESGSHVLKDFSVINNEISYRFSTKRLSSDMYSMTAMLNVDHCAKHFVAGDYINTYSYTFNLNGEVTEKNFDIKLDCIDEKNDYFLQKSYINTTDATTTTTTTIRTEIDEPEKPALIAKLYVRGTINLPSQGEYSELSHNSCMHILFYPKDIVCSTGFCSEHIVESFRIPLKKISSYFFEYDLTVFQLSKRKYLMRAIVNVGWCNKDLKSKTWIRRADYYTEKRHHIDLNEMNNNLVVKKDLHLKAFKKYHCGSDKCHVRERCVKHMKTNKYTCQCAPYACPCLSKPDWVCGSDGRTYSSECWMKSTDCFSGTIYTVKKGKCGHHHTGKYGKHHHGFHHTKFMSLEGIGLMVAGLVILLILIASLVILCKRRKPEQQTEVMSKVPYSKFEDEIKSSSLVFSVPDNEDKKAPSNFYATAPVKCSEGPEKVTPNEVYLEKVDYVKFGDEEDALNNTSNA